MQSKAPCRREKTPLGLVADSLPPRRSDSSSTRSLSVPIRILAEDPGLAIPPERRRYCDSRPRRRRLSFRCAGSGMVSARAWRRARTQPARKSCYVYSTARNNLKIASMDSQTGRATPGTSCVRHSCAVGAVSLVKRRTRLRAQRPKQSSGAHVRRGPHKNSRSNGSSAALLQRPL